MHFVRAARARLFLSSLIRALERDEEKLSVRS